MVLRTMSCDRSLVEDPLVASVEESCWEATSTSFRVVLVVTSWKPLVHREE